MDQSTASNLIILISGLALGIITGGASVLALVSRVKNDPALLAAIEGLERSWPKEVVDVLKQVSPSLRDTADIIDEITDGVPVSTKHATTLPAP